MRIRPQFSGVAVLVALAVAVTFSANAFASEKPAPKTPPAKPAPPQIKRVFPPPHGGLPPVLKGLHEAAKNVPWQQFGKPAVDVAAALLSGNNPKILSEILPEILSDNQTKLVSDNEAHVLSGNAPNLLSGNEPEILSGNKAEVLSGNHISILSNIKIEIHISETGNNSGNEVPPPPRKPEPPKSPRPAKRR